MTLLILVLFALALLTLTVVFIFNALVIKRDINKKLDEFRDRLEADANSIVDDLLESSRPQDQDA